MRTALICCSRSRWPPSRARWCRNARSRRSGVSDFINEHPRLGPIYDRVGLFSVYTSPWFSAIYLLLFVSLVGCIIPRVGMYARALRARPPKTPRNLTRLPAYAKADIADQR